MLVGAKFESFVKSSEQGNLSFQEDKSHLQDMLGGDSAAKTRWDGNLANHNLPESKTGVDDSDNQNSVR